MGIEKRQGEEPAVRKYNKGKTTTGKKTAAQPGRWGEL